VLHYTQVLAKHTDRLSFDKNLPAETVTYHDPCYLGRHNGEYGSARKVLAALPGVMIREMDRSLQNTLCCGGGGGNLFTDILGNGPESPAQNRVTEALETDAHILAVGCPTCAIMLGDAVKSTNLDTHIRVREVSEIVNKRLGQYDPGN
jgi:Fe-S oxidoreductase